MTAVLPTSSMSGVRKHFWTEVRRLEGGSSSPRKYGLNGCIPATVRSVEVSSGAGISDAEGTRRWPRSSKNERYASRISAGRSFIGGAVSLGSAIAYEAMVAWPTTIAPSIRQAVWPGATP